MVTIIKHLRLFLALVSASHVSGARTRSRSRSVVSVVVTNAVTRDTCGGVLMTRYHVLVPDTCLKSQDKHYIVELGQGRSQQRVATPLDTPTDLSLAVLSLSSPLSVSSSDLRQGEVAAGQVNVLQTRQSYMCNMSQSLDITCQQPLDTLWPVTDVNKLLIGFIDIEHRLEPIKNQMSTIGELIASDLAIRFDNGERRLIKCKNTEKTALEFMMVGCN